MLTARHAHGTPRSHKYCFIYYNLLLKYFLRAQDLFVCFVCHTFYRPYGLGGREGEEAWLSAKFAAAHMVAS